MKKLLLLTAVVAIAVIIVSCGNNKTEKPLAAASDTTSGGENRTVKKSDTKINHVEIINTKFNSIENSLNAYTVEELYYTDTENYMLNASYTAYTKGGELVKLVEETGEEGYGIKNSFYFDDGDAYFMFQETTDPDGNEEQKSIYISNGKVVEAMTKFKDVNDMRSFDQIELKPDLEIINSENNNTKAIMEWVKTAKENYLKAKENTDNQ